MRSSRSTLETFLGLLEVKHTESFTDQHFNAHPYRPYRPYRFNLPGLSKMFSDYDVENGSAQITSKEQDLFEIVTPFIAQFGGGVVTVYKVDSSQVSFLCEGVNHVLPVDNLQF